MGRGVSLEEADDLRARWTEGRIEAAPYTWIQAWPQLLNPDPPIVCDIVFRRAVLHALDRQSWVDTFMHGLTTVAHSYLNPREPEYRDIEPQIVKYEYDPRRAMQLIEGLGYHRGPEGGYVDATNRKLSLEPRLERQRMGRALGLSQLPLCLFQHVQAKDVVDPECRRDAAGTLRLVDDELDAVAGEGEVATPA